MKSNILISSFAALCLMLSISEVPTNTSIEKNVTISANPFAYLPVWKSNEVLEEKLTVKTTVGSTLYETPTANDDFSYLKFDVTDYVADYEKFQSDMDEPASTYENGFDYLKFDVNKYLGNDISVNSNPDEMLVNNYNYLKFDVSKYAATDATNSEMTNGFESLDLDYLKFDTQKYSQPGEQSVEELPTAE